MGERMGRILEWLKLGGIALGTSALADYLFQPNGKLSHHIAAGTFYAASIILDHISTLRTFGEVNRAERLGFETGLYEANPFLPSRPESKDLFSPLYTALQLSLLSLSALAPAAGYGLTSARLYAAMHNFWLARRLRRDNDFAEARAKEAGQNCSSLQEELYRI